MRDRPELELTLPAIAENVSVVRHVLGGIAETYAIDPAVLSDLRLAASEACANAVIHAYPEDAGLFVLRFDADDDALHLSVADYGAGMAPRADSPGLGVGLPLIATLTDRLEILTPEGGGTEVVMSFARQPLEMRDAAAGPHE